MPSDFVVVDTETTGLDFKNNRIIEIGAIKVSNFEIVDTFETLVSSVDSVPEIITQITGITTNQILHEAENPLTVYPRLRDFIGDLVFVAHNALFDYNFINSELLRYSIKPITNPYICTLKLARKNMPELMSYKLSSIKNYLGIDVESHRAMADTIVCLELVKRLKDKVKVNNFHFDPSAYGQAKLLKW